MWTIALQALFFSLYALGYTHPIASVKQWKGQVESLYCNVLSVKPTQFSLAVLPLRIERKGLGNVAYTTCTRWNVGLVTRWSLLKRVIAVTTTSVV